LKGKFFSFLILQLLMESWIKLYRKFDKWEWFNCSEMVHLFIYLLLNANNFDSEWRGVKIKRGQILTGRKILHEKTNISEQTLRTCLRRLENTKEITIQSTNQFSIITICNYEIYQESKNGINQPSNQPLTSDQPAINHKQEYKELKNERMKMPPTLEMVKRYCEFRDNKIDPQYFLDQNTMKGWVYGKSRTPIKDWQAAIRTWEKFNKTDNISIEQTTVNEYTR
jgi:hypothetical protein